MLVRRGDEQTAVHLGDPIDGDRLDQHVGGYRVEVVEPLRKLRVVLEETEGIARTSPGRPPATRCASSGT